MEKEAAGGEQRNIGKVAHSVIRIPVYALPGGLGPNEAGRARSCNDIEEAGADVAVAEFQRIRGSEQRIQQRTGAGVVPRGFRDIGQS